jgi:hypothetical protein
VFINDGEHLVRYYGWYCSRCRGERRRMLEGSMVEERRQARIAVDEQLDSVFANVSYEYSAVIQQASQNPALHLAWHSSNASNMFPAIRIKGHIGRIRPPKLGSWKKKYCINFPRLG